MWIFSTHGFFSINTDPTNAANLQFRARSNDDLLALRRAFPGNTKRAQIKFMKTTDYPWRMSLHRDQVAAIVQMMAAQIHYANFKGEIGTIPEQEDKLEALHRVWAVMRAWQDHHDRQPLPDFMDPMPERPAPAWSETEEQERGKILLRAAFDIIRRSEEQSSTPNFTKAHWDGMNLNGNQLAAEIAAYLDLDEDTEPLPLTK